MYPTGKMTGTYEQFCASIESIPGEISSEEKVRLLHGCLGILTEAGELADVVKKNVFYGKPIGLAESANIREELGDLLWYMAIFMNNFGWTFEEVMADNVTKLKRRYPNSTFSSIDALNRADKSGEEK